MTDKKFLEEVQEFFKLQNIVTSLYERQGKTCKYYILCTNSKKETEKLCNFIYQNDDEFCLERKKNKFVNYKKLGNTVLS